MSAQERAFPLEHDKRCKCSDPAVHRLHWTNWKLVQAEQALATKDDAIAQAVQAAEFKVAAHIWYSVLDLIAAGTPIEGLRTIATQQTVALRARPAEPGQERSDG